MNQLSIEQDLQKQYKYIRKTRPDGNCFFRAFSFAYFESLINDSQEFKRFYKLSEESKEELVKQGFPQFTIEDFHETVIHFLNPFITQFKSIDSFRYSFVQFLDVLKKIESGITSEQLIEELDVMGVSDYVVVYMRLITSGHLQKESEFFANFIEGDRTLAEFCKQEVEPMYKESDHIHITALTAAVKVGVRIIYMV